MTNHKAEEEKDPKKRKKKARGALLIFLGRLRTTCGVCDKASEWYDFLKDNLKPVLDEFSDDLPKEAVTRINEAFHLADTTKEGINRTCKNLQKDVSKIIQKLPGGGGILGSGAIGVFVLGAVVVGAAAAYLNSVAVKITIKNNGCDPIVTTAWVPVKFPGLEFPTAPIVSGGSGAAKVPPATFTVDASSGNTIRLTAFGMNMNFQMETFGIDVRWNGSSLLEKTTTVNLGERKEHTVDVNCR